MHGFEGIDQQAIAPTEVSLMEGRFPSVYSPRFRG
jgi:hypothetical protein